jgi:thymidylate kinase
LLEAEPALGLVRRLCEELRDEDIHCCHWKSNAALDRSARGENDLDLLVRRSHVQRFTEILQRLQFKEARATPSEQLPGVLDYYGYDPEAERLVHVHAHYQLVLGYDRTKNYRLPIESAFLESSAWKGLFRVPEPELEFIVFVIRMTVKHSSWERALLGEGALPASARAELEYLEARIDQARVWDLLAEHLPYLDAGTFRACAESLHPGASIWTRMRAARRLLAQLKPHARRSRLVEVHLALARRALRAARWRTPAGPPRKRLAAGGALIALVGGDGAGKSTAVEGLHRWLARDLDARKVHLGKPPWSLTTWTVRSVLKIVSLLVGLLPFGARGGAADSAGRSSFEHYRRLLWWVCVARDRQRAYVKARRFATEGGLMVCDRYHLPQLSLMEGPLVELATGDRPRGRWVRLLARIERKYHASIAGPEVLAVLRVDPEIAVQRKPEESPESVFTRSSEVWERPWQGTHARVIDASRTAEQVLAELKSFVWAEL